MKPFSPAHPLAQRRTQRGFTLLEAIVALVLVAGTGMALYGWINTNLISLGRVQQVSEREQVVRSALALMEQVNPLQSPAGEYALDEYVIEWQAQEVETPRQGVGVSLYEVGLYDTQVSITSNNEEFASFVLRQVGYRQTRQINLGL